MLYSLQAVLQNSGIIFAVPFSILLLGDKKRYLSPLPLLCIGLVAASIAVSVLPTVLEGHAGDGFNGANSIGWILAYLAGIVPGALYNTLQQKYLLRSGALQPGVSSSFVTKTTLRMLFWCNLWQTLWLGALWWLDITPHFGFSDSPSSWWDNTLFSLSCSVAGKAGAIAHGGGTSADQCVSVWGTSPSIWAFAFAIAYSVSYIGSAQLNRESSTFNLMVAVVTVALTSGFFLIPGTNPNSNTTPLWSVLVSLALSLTGMILWKVWESRVPPSEQFSVAVAVEKGYGALLSDEYSGDTALDAYGSSGAGYASGYGYSDMYGGYEDDRSYYLGPGARLGWN